MTQDSGCFTGPSCKQFDFRIGEFANVFSRNKALDNLSDVRLKPRHPSPVALTTYGSIHEPFKWRLPMQHGRGPHGCRIHLDLVVDNGAPVPLSKNMFLCSGSRKIPLTRAEEYVAKNAPRWFHGSIIALLCSEADQLLFARLRKSGHAFLPRPR